MEERIFYIKDSEGVLHELNNVSCTRFSTDSREANTERNGWNRNSFSLSFDVKPTKELNGWIESMNNIYEWMESRRLGIFFRGQY